MRTTTLLIALLLTVGSAGALHAQDAAASFGEELQVTEVLLDVLVTDRQNNVIIGLDKGDFQIQEDGEPVQIDSLTFYSNHQLLSPEAAQAIGSDIDDIPQDRFFILFFHDQRNKVGEAIQILSRQLDSGRQSKRWVREEMLPGDHVAVVSYDAKLKLHQDFTRSKKELMAAIDRAMKGKDSGNWASRIDEQRPLSLAQFLPRGNDLRDRTETIYEGLQVLSDAAGQIQGRKNLILFTLGFGDLDSFGLYKPDARYHNPTVQRLNDNNVAAYTIDLSPPGVRHSLQDGMNHFALETGGEYLFNFTSFITPLRRISEANSGYYLLAYRASHQSGKKGFQKVKVTTNNPEFKVRARSGYLFGEEL